MGYGKRDFENYASFVKDYHFPSQNIRKKVTPNTETQHPTNTGSVCGVHLNKRGSIWLTRLFVKFLPTEILVPIFTIPFQCFTSFFHFLMHVYMCSVVIRLFSVQLYTVVVVFTAILIGISLC